MPWDFGAGVAAAAGAGAGLMADSIKRERDLQGATDLEALKQKIEQDKQARIAAIVGGVSRTKDVPIAGVNPDGTAITATDSQPKTEGEYSRDVGDALTKTGMINESGKFYERADRSDDRHELRTTQAAKQKSDDEKWRSTFEEAKRHNKSMEAKAAAQLGLKDKEAKEFAKAADSYIEGKAQYDMLIAEGKGNDPDIIAAAKQQMDRAALDLKQYRIDVGAETSEFAKHLNLSATLEKLNKTIADPMTDAPTIEKAKVARDQVLTQMTAVTGSKGGDAGGDDIRYDAKGNAYKKGPDGKPVLITGAAKPTPTAAAATMPAPSVLAKPYVPQTPEEARLSMQGGATAADRIGSIIDSVKDIRKKTGADKY